MYTRICLTSINLENSDRTSIKYTVEKKKDQFQKEFQDVCIGSVFWLSFERPQHLINTVRVVFTLEAIFLSSYDTLYIYI